MKALFVAPLPFATAASSPPASAGSVANLNNDRPGLIWRGSTTSSITIDLGGSPSYDTIALIGSNLRATDTVRVSTGADGNVFTYTGEWLPAYSGDKPDELTAKTIIKLPTVRNDRFVRITFNAPSHPLGYVQFQRLVIGKAVSTLGIKFGAKINFEDRSIITNGEGFTDIDRIDVLPGWDFTTTGISDQSMRLEWAPLLLKVGSSKGLLFVRDGQAPETWQTDAIFGRMTSKTAMEVIGYDYWTFAGTIIAFAP